jgi:alpha-mannosidase
LKDDTADSYHKEKESMKHRMRWTSEKLQQRLNLIEPLVYRKRQRLSPFRCLELPGPLAEPPIAPDVDTTAWDIIEPYTYWAKAKTDFVMQTHFGVPGDWAVDSPVALYLPLGEPGSFSHPEALLYIDGIPFAATDRHHQEVLLPIVYADGQSHCLALHGWSGNQHHEDENARLFMRPCELVQIDQPTRDFAALARTALGIANHLDDTLVVKSKLLNALDAAFVVLDTREPFADEFYDSVSDALATLRAGIGEAGPAMDVSVAAVGHAHIDVAWLWTLGQTRRKAERTFHTVLHLMKRFPGYRFTQSQPQLYEFIRQDHPALFEEIKARVVEGRWEPIGGMWVEADCNLSGSEALVRQFVLGRQFFRDHFGPGAESPILWLPDVFGYAWALPQIIKKSGLAYFMTIKTAWNQYNRFPYDSFWWQGLDGTRILTHFSPTPEDGMGTKSTYNAKARPGDVLDTWTNFLQKDQQTDLLMPFGYGDGGGGPTREMLETIRDLADFPGSPCVRHDTAINFFRKMDAEAGDQLPTWSGELYLEYHRGTYTTQARNKLANRRSEFALHDAEFLCTFAALLDNGFEYPTQTLRDAWKLVCLNQFHDILPGSSITEVYIESQEQYEEIARLVSSARDAALDCLAARVAGDLLFINPTSFARDDLVLWRAQLSPDTHLETPDGTVLVTQSTPDGALIAPPALPPYSLSTVNLINSSAPAVENTLRAGPAYLENAFVRVEFTAEGDIKRIYDKINTRDVLPPDALANQFQAFEDRPMAHDAWDIDIYYDDKMWLSEPASRIEIVESGPLRATLEIERCILSSAYTQRISLFHNSPEIRVTTNIDWQERHILLKVAFPVNILAPTATHEIQWGNVERPTHRNTSWDWARFETCAHKWVDLSEADYGVSLLNDCKYGHDIHDNVIRLSLLRSPTHPDPVADLGDHTFTYSLLPHAGDWRTCTIPAAYALNDPVHVVESAGGSGAPIPLLVAVNRDNVVIETIKRAEDGNGIIVRLYECHRKRGFVTLEAGFDLQAVTLASLIEDDEQPVAFNARQITLPIKPYEIMTLCLVPANR